MKKCSRCKKIKDLKLFYKSKGKAYSWCKDCFRQHKRMRRRQTCRAGVERKVRYASENPEKYKKIIDESADYFNYLDRSRSPNDIFDDIAF